MNELKTNLFPCIGQRQREGCLPRVRALSVCLSRTPFLPLTTATTTTSAARRPGAKSPKSSLLTSFGKKKPTKHGRRQYTGLRLIVKRCVTEKRISLVARVLTAGSAGTFARLTTSTLNEERNKTRAAPRPRQVLAVRRSWRTGSPGRGG